jgi:hypothetical protein
MYWSVLVRTGQSSVPVWIDRIDPVPTVSTVSVIGLCLYQSVSVCICIRVPHTYILWSGLVYWSALVYYGRLML